jgi:aquaporin-9
MFLLGRLPLIKFFIYTIAQFIGAFLGAAIVYINYLQTIQKYEQIKTLKTADIFATYSNVSSYDAFFDQIFVTSLLLIIILAVTDKKNEELSQATIACLLGISITIIGIAFGYNCG